MKGEFEFIGDIRKAFPSPQGITGIGDDCAIIPQQNGWDTLVSTDILVEGTHFLKDDITPYQLGWKAGAVNISDIAAMGGYPTGSFLALALPKKLDSDWENEFLRGYGDISREYGFPLLGGDTTASPDGIGICITVLGKAPHGKSLRRNTAKAGDLICVTGTLGDSAAGLEAILKGLPRSRETEALIGRHYLPRPRLTEGQQLAASPGVHAMMDISDGIGSDLRHIMEESGLGAEVDVRAIPLSEEMTAFCAAFGSDPVRLALEGGEDYELLFTVQPDSEPDLKVPHTVIGTMTKETTLVWKGSDIDYCGYRHF